MGQGGKAGQITEFKTTAGFEHPDGMRAYGKNGLLVVEGADAGRFDIIDDQRRQRRGQDGERRLQTTGLGLAIGNTAWVLEGQLATLFDPPEKRGKPGPFRAYEWNCRDNSRHTVDGSAKRWCKASWSPYAAAVGCGDGDPGSA